MEEIGRVMGAEVALDMAQQPLASSLVPCTTSMRIPLKSATDSGGKAAT